MGNYLVIIYPLRKNQLLSLLFIYLIIPLTPLFAFEPGNHLVIESLVKGCYKYTDSCKTALNKIHNYQIKASSNKKFSCQTRLLGLEANLIMAMNSNLKRSEVKSIIQAVKKYC